MLKISPKGTVPVLQLTDGQVIDESIDIVEYALETQGKRESCEPWLSQWQPRWVTAIQHYKYHDRYPQLDREESWTQLKTLLVQLNNTLAENNGYLLGNRFSQLDILLLPLVRQFAIIDDTFFRAQGWKHLEKWLDDWMASSIYEATMAKHPVWTSHS